MMEFTNLTINHVIEIYPRRRKSGGFLDITLDQTIQTIRYYQSMGPTYAAIYKGKVVAIGGVLLISSKVGHGWLVGSDDLYECKKWFHKNIKKYYKDIMENNGLHRLQAEAIADTDMYKNWLLALGFKEEGIMKKYGENGEDYIRMAYVI